MDGALKGNARRSLGSTNKLINYKRCVDASLRPKISKERLEIGEIVGIFLENLMPELTITL